MTPPLALAQPTGLLYRIGRRPDAWAWPDWSYAGDDLTFGNRYDDPRGQYRVLYANDRRRGAFAETLARFRADLAIVAEYEHIEGDAADEAFAPALPPGVVPAEWLDDRVLGTAAHAGRFADVGHSDSVSHLRAVLAGRVLHYGFDDLDAGDLRRRAPRGLTQEISRHLFEHGRDAAGRPLAGLRYLSRLGDDLANWAIFEPSDPSAHENRPIDHGDPDLHAVLALFSLALHQATRG